MTVSFFISHHSSCCSCKGKAFQRAVVSHSFREKCKTRCCHYPLQQFRAFQSRSTVTARHSTHLEAYRLQRSFLSPSLQPLLFICSPTAPTEFSYSCSKPKSAQAKLLTQAFPDVYDFGWPHFVSLSTLALILLSLVSPSFQPQTAPPVPIWSFPRARTKILPRFVVTAVPTSTLPSLIFTPLSLLFQSEPRLSSWLDLVHGVPLSFSVAETSVGAIAREITQMLWKVPLLCHHPARRCNPPAC